MCLAANRDNRAACRLEIDTLTVSSVSTWHAFEHQSMAADPIRLTGNDSFGPTADWSSW